MKRMLTQKMIDKLYALLQSIEIGVFAPNKINLGSVADLEIADLGALFPTAENGKFLRWYNGVLENADVIKGYDVDSIDFTASDFGGTGQLPAESETELSAETRATYVNLIKALIKKGFALFDGNALCLSQFNYASATGDITAVFGVVIPSEEQYQVSLQIVDNEYLFHNYEI